MNPSEGQPDNGARNRVLAPNLEPDVNCAAAIGVPVLITADNDMAEWIARVIHERSQRKSEAFVVYHPGRGDQLGLLKGLMNGTGPGRGTLFVADVGKTDPEVQAFLRDTLAAPQPDLNAPFRIMAGTSGWLFDQMERGQFDHFLFYRLNKIHIRVGVPHTTDRPDASASREEAPMTAPTLDVAAFRRNRVMLRAGMNGASPARARAGRQW